MGDMFGGGDTSAQRAAMAKAQAATDEQARLAAQKRADAEKVTASQRRIRLGGAGAGLLRYASSTSETLGGSGA